MKIPDPRWAKKKKSYVINPFATGDHKTVNVAPTGVSLSPFYPCEMALDAVAGKVACEQDLFSQSPFKVCSTSALQGGRVAIDIPFRVMVKVSATMTAAYPAPPPPKIMDQSYPQCQSRS